MSFSILHYHPTFSLVSDEGPSLIFIFIFLILVKVLSLYLSLSSYLVRTAPRATPSSTSPSSNSTVQLHASDGPGSHAPLQSPRTEVAVPGYLAARGR